MVSWDLADPIETKIEKVVTKVYGGSSVRYSNRAKAEIRRIQAQGFGNLPVCIAKTQYSFSDDALAIGAAKDFAIYIGDVVLNNGAGFVVAVAGQIMRMPGLPKDPQANRIDLVDGGIEGLS